MQLIDLQSIPNQIFSIVLDGVDYRIKIRTIQDLTFMSVWQGNTLLFLNQLCVPNGFVNPYKYVSGKGKLYFACIDNEYPNYRLFGNTQKLYFLDKEEVDEAS